MVEVVEGIDGFLFTRFDDYASGSFASDGSIFPVNISYDNEVSAWLWVCISATRICHFTVGKLWP